MLKPFPFQQWIDEHRHLLQPPVGNKQVFHDSTFIVMVVGGPNKRTDFHVNETDEFFYQLEGDMVLKIFDQDKGIIDIPIRQGEVFMIKALIPHSPQRPAGSVGMVVEKTRAPNERDGLQWYCEKCCHKLYEEFFHLTNIEKQFDAVFERYYSGSYSQCSKCGYHNGKKWSLC